MNLSDNMQNWFNFDPFCITGLKWVSNLIQQAYCKLPQICFLYTLCRPNEKTAQALMFHFNLQPSFTIESLMVFPFNKILTDNLKTDGLMYLYT